MGARNATVLTMPIAPGREEAWRRFMQELEGSRAAEYEAFRRGVGLRNERVWLARAGEREVTVAYVELNDLDAAFDRLAESEGCFECWLKERLTDLHGMSLRRLRRTSTREQVFAATPAGVSRERVRARGATA